MADDRIPVGVIAIGMVGTQLARYFQEVKGYTRGRDLFLYDIAPEKGFFDDINKADIIFVSVPTPRGPDGKANLSAVESAFSMIVAPKVVVLKSTVPPGTTESLQQRYPQLKVLFNPENLTERFAWEDFLRPDDQIVGFTEKSIDAAQPVLALLPKAPFMSPWGVNTYGKTMITATEAELIKYARNVHFARKINFANVLAAFAEKLGVNYENVRKGMSADRRIGDSHLDVAHGGYRGFGGACLPKDLDAFIGSLAATGLAAESAFMERDSEFNKSLLASQGLTVEDVSVHDHEWVEKKLAGMRHEEKRKVV